MIPAPTIGAASIPIPMSLSRKLRRESNRFMGDIADAAGLAPDLVFAIRKTGLLVTKNNQDRLDEDQRAAWKDALAEYESRKRVI